MYIVTIKGSILPNTVTIKGTVQNLSNTVTIKRSIQYLSNTVSDPSTSQWEIEIKLV